MGKELTVLGIAIVLVFGVVIFAALNSGYGESIYLYQDGSTPLTANWDAVYNITSGAINFGNASYIITNNGAGDLLFIDINTGSKTLAELLAGGGSGWDGTGALFQNGTRVLTADWNQGAYNLTNTDSWFLGKLNASQLLTGTLALTYIPTMDDAHIPDVDTLSYGTSFVLAQIPSIPDSKLVESGEYLLRNGTVALTGNWNVGGFDVTNIGAMVSTSLDTGLGANELYDMDQNVLSTSNVDFNNLTLAEILLIGTDAGVIYWGAANDVDLYRQGVAELKTSGKFIAGTLEATTLDTGEGANELYDMDQNVLTTSDVDFNNVTVADHLLGAENMLSTATNPVNSHGNSFSTIQATIDDLAGDGWVYVPQGTWNEAVTISNANTHLFGAGKGITIINGGTTGHGISASSTRITISDLTAKTNQAGGNSYDGIAFSSAFGTVLNVEISSSDRYGISTSGSFLAISNSLITNTDDDGVYVGSVYAVITGNHFQSIGDMGVEISGGGTGTTVSGNFFVTIGDDGVYVAPESCTVTGNSMVGVTNEEVDDDSSTSIISGNTGGRLTRLFVEPSWNKGNATETTLGTHSAMLIDTNLDTCYFEFSVPLDFLSCNDATAIYVIVYPTDTHFARSSTETQFGRTGEDYNQHGESGAWGNYAGLTANKLVWKPEVYQYLLTGVAARDVVGLRYTGYLSGATYLDHYILGIEFEYLAKK